MAQTKEGALKTKQRLIAKYGENYYREIGAMGGKVKSPTKGFGYDKRNILEKLFRKPKLAKTAGRVGGKISKRTKVS